MWPDPTTAESTCYDTRENQKWATDKGEMAACALSFLSDALHFSFISSGWLSACLLLIWGTHGARMHQGFFANHVHPFIEKLHPDGRTIRSATKQKWSRDGLGITTTNSSTIFGMCWMNRSNAQKLAGSANVLRWS